MVKIALRFERLDVEAEQAAQFAALLDPHERERAARFRYDLHRRRFIVRRGLLRTWLGEALGLAPQDVSIVVDDFGKLSVPGWGQYFNISHSGEVMLIATGPVELGCDIEAIDPGIDWRPLAERLFAPEEKAALAALDDAAGRQAFFRCWARKEAFVKAIGKGLSHPLDAFAVATGPEASLLRGGEGWAIAGHDLDTHACAVVVRADGTTAGGTPIGLDIVSPPPA